MCQDFSVLNNDHLFGPRYPTHRGSGNSRRRGLLVHGSRSPALTLCLPIHSLRLGGERSDGPGRDEVPKEIVSTGSCGGYRGLDVMRGDVPLPGSKLPTGTDGEIRGTGTGGSTGPGP